MSKTKTFSTKDNKVSVKLLGRSGSADGVAKPGFAQKIGVSPSTTEPKVAMPGGAQQVKGGKGGSEPKVAKPGGNQIVRG